MLLSAGLAALLAILPVTAAAAAQGQVQAQGRPSAGIAIPITGTSTGSPAGVENITGTFTLQRFANQGGELVAIGTLVASVTNAAGAVTTLVAPVAVPIVTSATGAATAVTTATCEILNLVLGPLDLNLLGLVIHLDTVALDITAVRGAGNLLGNLLCAIAGLLDGGGLLSELVGLLNNLLGALGG